MEKTPLSKVRLKVRVEVPMLMATMAVWVPDALRYADSKMSVVGAVSASTRCQPGRMKRLNWARVHSALLGEPLFTSAEDHQYT